MLTDSILSLKGVGEKTVKLFNRLGLYTLRDLLHYYTRDYDNFCPPVSIAHGQAGTVTALRGQFTGRILEQKNRSTAVLKATLQDETGAVQLVFFNMPFLKQTLKQGAWYLVRGRLKNTKETLVMEQAKFYQEEEYEALCKVLQPCYGLTKNLTNKM